MELTDLKVQELIENKQTFIVDLKGEWCGPCKMVSPIIDKLSEKYKDSLIIGKLDIDENPAIPVKFNVRGIPTVLFFKDGELVDSQVGSVSESVYEEKIEKLLNE